MQQPRGRARRPGKRWSPRSGPYRQGDPGRPWGSRLLWAGFSVGYVGDLLEWGGPLRGSIWRRARMAGLVRGLLPEQYRDILRLAPLEAPSDRDSLAAARVLGSGPVRHLPRKTPAAKMRPSGSPPCARACEPSPPRPW